MVIGTTARMDCGTDSICILLAVCLLLAVTFMWGKLYLHYHYICNIIRYCKIYLWSLECDLMDSVRMTLLGYNAVIIDFPA